MAKPISPDQVKELKSEKIPKKIIECLNGLILENFNGDFAKVLLCDLMSLLVQAGFDRNEVSEKEWFNIEDIYGKAGWEVTYEFASYGESYYEPYFIFSPK